MEKTIDIKTPSFGQLFGAYIIDGALLVISVLLISVFLIFGIGSLGGLVFVLVFFFGGLCIIPVWLLFVIYMSIMERGTGKSLGKKLMLLRVLAGESSQQEVPFWELLVAYFIDLSFASFVGVLLIAIWAESGDTGFFGLCGGVFAALLGSLYFAICESLNGKTLGKKLVGLHIVSDKDSK